MLPNTTVPVKVCSFDGCSGIMHFQDKNPAHWNHTAEWPWYAAWVCSKQPAHIEIVTDREYEEISRRQRDRERQQRHDVALPHLELKRHLLPRTPIAIAALVDLVGAAIGVIFAGLDITSAMIIATVPAFIAYRYCRHFR